MIKNIIIFAVGAAVGSGISYVVLKKKFDNDIQKELNKIREDYGFAACCRVSEDDIIVEDPQYVKTTDPKQRNNDRKTAEDIADSNGYLGDKEEGPAERDDIYVITPDEYVESNGYSKEDLTYFEGDETLADDEMDALDIHYTVGDTLKFMGQYEEDILHVRNDKLGVDYEITLDPRDYSMVAGPVEDE